MAGLSGDINLANLALPGTHNSAANYISLENGINITEEFKPKIPWMPWGLDKDLIKALHNVDALIDGVVGFYALNQNSTITEQLNNGIRYLDLRFNYDQATNSMFIAHGTVKYASLDLVMQEIEAWLAGHPTETVLIAPRIYNNSSDEQLQKFFYNRYVYTNEEGGGGQKLRTFTETKLRNNPYINADALQTPLIGKDIFYRGTTLPNLSEARGKAILLDAQMQNGLRQASLLGIKQDAWDTSSLKEGIPEKVELIKKTVGDIANQELGKLNENHFQLSPGAPKFSDILPSDPWDWVGFAWDVIKNPNDFAKILVKRVFTPILPPLGFASRLNKAAKDVLSDLTPENRTRGLWVGDFTDGTVDFADLGIQAFTDALGLPEDTSKLSSAERALVNTLLAVSEGLKSSTSLEASDVTNQIIRQNLGAVISIGSESLEEGESTELRFNWFDPSISNLFFTITPSSDGATIDDIIIGSGLRTTGYTISQNGTAWRGSVEQDATGYLLLSAANNQDSSELTDSFSLQLFRDNNLEQKLGNAVSFSVSPGKQPGNTKQFLYSINLDIANTPWAGSGDEGNAASRHLSSITLIINGKDKEGKELSSKVILNKDNYKASSNDQRLQPFQRGSSTRFNVFLNEDLDSIQSVSIQASNTDKDRIDLSALSVSRIAPISGNNNANQRSPLFNLRFDQDAFKVTDQNGKNQYRYKSGLTQQNAFRINNTASSTFEILPYLGGSNSKISTTKGDVWFHVLDKNGERTPVSQTSVDPTLPTFIITHGFTGGSGDRWLAGKIDAVSTTHTDWRINDKDLLQWQTFYGDDHALALSVQEAYRDKLGKVQANIILADWGNFSVIGNGGTAYASYAKVAEEHVPAAGRAIADYVKSQGIDPGQVTLLGHSLGGHVMGFAGQAIQEDAKSNPEIFADKAKEIGTIIAMDPAGPMYETWAPQKRLSNGDATKVIAIHTDSLMGFDAPLGSHDLYLNAFYGIARSTPNITKDKFQSELENIYRGADSLYLQEKIDNAYAQYLSLGLGLTWDPSFTWYKLETETIQGDSRAWFQKQHNYSMAALANIFLEEKRLSDPNFQLPSWLSSSTSELNNPNQSLWVKTFKTQFDDFRNANSLRSIDGLPLTYSTLVKGESDGGIFSLPQFLKWNDGENQDWKEYSYQFLKPDTKFMGSSTIPFSDFTFFWNDTGSDLTALTQDQIKSFISKNVTNGDLPIPIIPPDYFNSDLASLLGGPQFYNRYLSPDFGLAPKKNETVGSFTSLGGTSIADIGGAKLLAGASSVHNSMSNWMDLVYGLKQQVFGGPVVNGDVVLDLRTYNETASNIISNLNLVNDDSEMSTKTDATGSFIFNNLADPNTIGNRDGILDFRDGMVIAGLNKDGSISVLDSISGSDYGFPLVGIPGGNITLLTTLKYATLLRWTPKSNLLGEELTPDLITKLFAQIIKDVPEAFTDDSFDPYHALSSNNAIERTQGIDSLAFAYEHLAVIKVISEMLKTSKLIYGDNTAEDLALWGRSIDDPLDSEGIDRAELVAFTAYGLAIQQLFTAERPFDVGNGSHLREVLINVLANYPTEALVEGEPTEFKTLFALAQQATDSSPAARNQVKQKINEKLGSTLDHISRGLETINSVLEDRFQNAAQLSEAIPAIGTQLLIPTISGPKRFMADTLGPELVRLARQYQDSDDFDIAFNQLLYSPLAVDAPNRSNPFIISITTGLGQSAEIIEAAGSTAASFTLTITDREGNRQPAPDYGLAVRFRLGGNAIEGLDYVVGDNLYHRLLTIAPGESEATIELPVNPIAPSMGDSVIQIELLSADSGYAVNGDRAVASAILGSNSTQDISKLNGKRSSFIPHALIASNSTEEAWIVAPAQQNNLVLRGQPGRKDNFVIGGQYLGIPHIENFDPEDGDKIHIDAAIWADNTDIKLSREKLSQVVNTYAGYVFDLLSGSPLALVSNYSTETGDQAWTGLSSDPMAEYFDIAPTSKSAGIEIAGRTMVRGSVFEITFAEDISQIMNTSSALELIAVNPNNPSSRQVVMTRPGDAAGIPLDFMGVTTQLGFIGRLADNATSYEFSLRNLATGELTALTAESIASDMLTTRNKSLFTLKNRQGATIASIFSHNTSDGEKPINLTEEIRIQAAGNDPIIGISLQELETTSSKINRSLSITFDLYRESAYNNRLGLYLADRETLAPIDRLTGNAVMGSISDVLQRPNNLAAWLGDVVANGYSQVTAALAIPESVNVEDVVLLPYLKTGDAAGSIILPAASLNRDGINHQLLSGLNTFGFEDWIGAGSDWDYDDVIAQISRVELATT